METQPWGQERERSQLLFQCGFAIDPSFESFRYLGTYLDTYQVATGKVLRGRFVRLFCAPYIAESSYDPTSDSLCWTCWIWCTVKEIMRSTASSNIPNLVLRSQRWTLFNLNTMQSQPP